MAWCCSVGLLARLSAIVVRVLSISISIINSGTEFPYEDELSVAMKIY